MRVQFAQAIDLFEIKKVNSKEGKPSWANLVFNVKKDHGFNKNGIGLYSIFYKGKIIYLGKYLGDNRDPSKGDVLAVRWKKHLQTLSFRGRNVSLSKRPLLDLLNTYPRHSLVKDLSASDLKVITCPDGNVSSINRVRFAMDNWKDFKNFSLENFSFLYIQVNPKLINHISLAEKDLIKELMPYCNFETPKGDHLFLGKKQVKTKMVKRLSNIKQNIR